MTFLLIIVFLCSSLTCFATDPDENRDADQLIRSRGFEAETHYVTTEDGYILGVQRIVNPLFKSEKKRPVLLQHGLLSSSVDWIINSPGPEISKISIEEYFSTSNRDENNLGFALANLGYDVWLANSRGNTYSTNHTTLNPAKDKKFWEFTFDEMSKYDLPATLKYVLKETGTSELSYVGHSQGTLIMFALLSEQPDYAKIIKPFVALAPVARVAHMKSPIKFLADNPIIMTYFKFIGGKFLPKSKITDFLAETVCKSPIQGVCSNILFLLCGYDSTELNTTRLPVYYTHTPAGTSTWNVIHFGQNYLSGKFQKFDYNYFKNIERYGSPEPPEYDLSKITSKNIALFHSQNDWFVDPRDFDFLLDSLHVPLLEIYEVPKPKWNHIDFVWAEQAGKEINEKIVKLFNDHKYTPENMV